LSVCVLSSEEAGRLENYGIWPTCKAHLHWNKEKAVAAVEADTHRFVGGPDTAVDFVSAIVMASESRLWEPVACHDLNGRAIQGMRTWGKTPLR
jgi:hypothetical protein